MVSVISALVLMCHSKLQSRQQVRVARSDLETDILKRWRGNDRLCIAVNTVLVKSKRERLRERLKDCQEDNEMVFSTTAVVH